MLCGPLRLGRDFGRTFVHHFCPLQWLLPACLRTARACLYKGRDCPTHQFLGDFDVGCISLCDFLSVRDLVGVGEWMNAPDQ
jgi:hypothetical protein